MNSVNHGEKHSLSIIFLLRDDTYLILPFFHNLLLWIVMPDEDSKCLICFSWRGSVKPFSEHWIDWYTKINNSRIYDEKISDRKRHEIQAHSSRSICLPRAVQDCCVLKGWRMIVQHRSCRKQILTVKPLLCSCPILCPCFQFLTGLLLTVLTDIIHISIFYPSHDYLSDAKRFSVGMAIFSLLLKPVSCYLVYRMYRERGGEYTLNIGRSCFCFISVWATSSGLHFSLSSVLLDSALHSRQAGCSLCLVHVCDPILSFWCVLGLKFIFFLSPLAEMTFWHLNTILPTVVLRGFSSLPPPAFVCLLETLGYPFFVNPFFFPSGGK